MATIRINANDLLNALEDAETKARIAVRMYCEEGAKTFENYAKKNRPWRDRTGHARQRLKGYVEERGNRFRINIAHGVDYGKSLEYEHERRYAILEPTVNAKSAEVLRGFKTILKRVFGND